MDNVNVYFSPKGGCEAAIVKAIQDAKATIAVLAYSFTSEPIAKALVKANDRGLAVSVVFDKDTVKNPKDATKRILKSNVEVMVDSEHAIAHNKVMVIDESIVITGSFNFTNAAENKNAENVLIISDNDIASLYHGNWINHYFHSKKVKNEKVCKSQKKKTSSKKSRDRK